jgi:tetratricopeptide (TPR) repeat protein
MSKIVRSFLLFLLVYSAGHLAAQEKLEFPQVSQHAVVKQRVALTDVEIDYSRPNKNNREIFGGVVPFGKLWRTGANAPTRIRFSGAVKLNEKEIPAGEYALFTIPTADEWTIILSKDAKVQSAADYKEENDAARFTATPIVMSTPAETFAIGLTDVKSATATLYLEWDQTRVPVKLATDDVEELSKRLEAAAAGPTPLQPQQAYQAASFYYDNNKDMQQASKWIDQAIEKNPKSSFMWTRKAQILARLGNKREAIAAAEKSTEILKAAPVEDTAAIQSNTQLIESLR